MEEEIIILSCKQYKIDGGMSGTTMYYVHGSQLKACEHDNVLGLEPVKENMPYEFFERAKAFGVPCVAKAHFVMKNRQGSTVLKIDGLDFLAAAVDIQ